MTIIETLKPTEGEIREMLSEVGIDVTASSWSYPGYTVIAGQTVVPSTLDGVLIIDTVPVYSSAWL